MKRKSFRQRSVIVSLFIAGSLVSGCGVVPDSGQQLAAGINAGIDATPTNAERAERRAKAERERQRRAEERKRQVTLREARRRQTEAAAKFQREGSGGEGGGDAH
ncbi:hypothetical protein [Hoeflea sp.]|uniref:hypothetical protein n=1 Tax=Hoeflea sp. TaxID=1940281 RepID=UPI003B52AE24